ncbi:hypothetical protein TeGR_g8656 [Tetraparma gracilis]|jgi:uncharacterized membrane protein|uniref:Uncharacterized protein n=1 Tax=Tetraparma gracilis TaxID=2962635 RepID=A0ABQ6M783_9STRA|nr:hypothetical protein TeGR_g8656 [Tetraparma gracilis]
MSDRTNLHHISKTLSALIGLEHIGFYFMESDLWRTVGVKVFRVKREQINASAPLAANQGVYNLMVGLGLLFSAIPWMDIGGQEKTMAELTLKTAFEAHQAGISMWLTFLVYAVATYGWASLGAAGIMITQGVPGFIAMICAVCAAYEGWDGDSASDVAAFATIKWILVAVFTAVGLLTGGLAYRWKGMNDAAAKELEQTLGSPMKKKETPLT